MISTTFLTFLPYALVTAYTPGPNNILALNTVTKLGLRKGKNTIIGIAAGFLIVMIICALGCFVLAKILPGLTMVLKYIGAIYIFWLAYYIAKSKPQDESQDTNSSFWSGFILQLINIKIIIYAITIYTGYVIPVSDSFTFLLLAAVFNTIVGVSGTMSWAIAGRIFQKIINRYYIFFNAVMSLLLILSAIEILKSN